MATSSNARRCCAWLVALPMLSLGSQAAHALAYRFAYPSLSIRVEVLSATGHGYLAFLPLALGATGAVALCTLGWNAFDAARGRTPQPLPPAAFALLPLIGFTLQEFIERWFAVGGLPWWMVEQPTFRIGLALQLPFALAAFVATRLLLRGAQRLGLRLAHHAAPRRGVRVAAITLRAQAALAGCELRPSRPTRGPPIYVS